MIDNKTINNRFSHIIIVFIFDEEVANSCYKRIHSTAQQVRSGKKEGDGALRTSTVHHSVLVFKEVP